MVFRKKKKVEEEDDMIIDRPRERRKNAPARGRVAFMVRCNICGKPLSEGESPIEHVTKHPPSAYFSVVASSDLEWDSKG